MKHYIVTITYHKNLMRHRTRIDLQSALRSEVTDKQRVIAERNVAAYKTRQKAAEAAARAERRAARAAVPHTATAATATATAPAGVGITGTVRLVASVAVEEKGLRIQA